MSSAKLFVVSLPADAKTEELTNILRTYAEVNSVTLAWGKSPQGKKHSLGYGFVICTDVQNAQKLLNLSKKIKYKSRSLIFKEFKTGKKLKTEKSGFYFRRIFVHNISLKTNDKELGNFFSKYGPVEAAYVVDSPGPKRALFGFVVFKYEEDVANLLSLPNCFHLNGHSVRIQKYLGKKANTPEESDFLYSFAASPRPVVEGAYSQPLQTTPQRLKFDEWQKESSKETPSYQKCSPSFQRLSQKNPVLNTSQAKVFKQHSSFVEPSILKKVYENHLFENLCLRTSTNARGYSNYSNTNVFAPSELKKELDVSSKLTQPFKADSGLTGEKPSKRPTFDVSLVKSLVKINETYSQGEESPKDVGCQKSSFQSLATHQEDLDHLQQKDL